MYLEVTTGIVCSSTISIHALDSIEAHFCNKPIDSCTALPSEQTIGNWQHLKSYLGIILFRNISYILFLFHVNFYYVFIPSGLVFY